MNSFKPKPIDRSSSADVGVKPNSSKSLVLVKAKKGNARNRAALSSRSSIDEVVSAAGVPLPLNAQGKSLNEDRNDSGKKFLSRSVCYRGKICCGFSV